MSRSAHTRVPMLGTEATYVHDARVETAWRCSKTRPCCVMPLPKSRTISPRVGMKFNSCSNESNGHGRSSYRNTAAATCPSRTSKTAYIRLGIMIGKKSCSPTHNYLDLRMHVTIVSVLRPCFTTQLPRRKPTTHRHNDPPPYQVLQPRQDRKGLLASHRRSECRRRRRWQCREERTASHALTRKAVPFRAAVTHALASSHARYVPPVGFGRTRSA